MLTHCRGSSPSMEPTGSNPFHLLKITTLVLWCSPPHHITWCPASWLSWGSLQRPGIDFASFISVRVISGDPFMEEWFRKWFFFSDLKKNRKKHEQFSFCVHDMKTENPKMAINYLFDVGFDSFAYSGQKKKLNSGKKKVQKLFKNMFWVCLKLKTFRKNIPKLLFFSF